jgi:VIT1/CCC1 family predicted Fe2+/Mn2+ transporter
MNTDSKSSIMPKTEMSSKTSRPWGCAILSFISGALAVIVLLVTAYFGIRMFDISGRMPTRSRSQLLN